MKTKWMLLLVAAITPFAVAGGRAQSGDFRPMFVSPLTGTLRIQQEIPCASDVDQTTPVIAGRFEISPAEGIDVPGGKRFTLTRASVFFDGFSISRSCLGFGETRTYTEVGVSLGQAVAFTGFPTSPGIYEATIPQDSVFIFQAAIVNGNSEVGYRHPKEPVAATINLNDATVQMHIAVATKIHIERGCALGHCIINSDYNGTLTADLGGAIVFTDTDLDGVPDRNDNCKYTPNPTQAPVATPVVTPPGALTINSCLDHQIGAATGADVCDASLVTFTNNAPARFNAGANVVTWTGIDGKGRVGSGAQTVTVVDTTKPIFTLVPGPIALNDCKPAWLGLPTITDDCAGLPRLKNDQPWKFPVGPTVVTWTAKDIAGNQSTATQTVTVTDKVDPTARCEAVRKPNDRDWDRGWPWDKSDWDWDRDHDRDGHDWDKDYYRVSSTDSCTAHPSIKLGTFTLTNGEIIEIKQTKKAGIKLVNPNDPRHVRRFEVGPGQNVIVTRDGSGNTEDARCVDPDHR